MRVDLIQIGDYFAYPTQTAHDGKLKIGRVNFIRHDGIVQVDFVDTNAQLLEPIAITPSILENNGFIEITKRIKKLIWLWKENGVLVEILEETPNVYKLTIHHDSSDLSDQRIYVRHLHELQHALKLLGKEIVL